MEKSMPNNRKNIAAAAAGAMKIDKKTASRLLKYICKEYKKQLAYLGSVSGREENKIKDVFHEINDIRENILNVPEDLPD